MATKKESATSMTLKVATGTSDEGKTIFGNRTVNNVNPVITDEDFCIVAAALADLQKNTLATVSRVNTSVFELDDD